jgi:uncharacterized protein (DUF924 family)
MPDWNPEEIHDFWFADATADAAKADERMSVWFNSNRETDEFIAERYTDTVRDASEGLLALWEAQPRPCVALVIVLDQFPRNIYRGTAAAFQYDGKALSVARRGISAGHLGQLTTIERGFFLMPFQHCEDLACQREGLVLCQQMVDEAPAEWRMAAKGIMYSARQHLEIIERFGRFPHRNAILGRTSTPAELQYLASNNEAFGQRAQ